MSGKKISSLACLAVFATILLTVCRAAGQTQAPDPLVPNDPRLNFEFSVKPGRKPLLFKVKLDKVKLGNAKSSVSVYRKGESRPFQTLPGCVGYDFDLWQVSELINHDDFNFDGFEDLKLFGSAGGHLGNESHCIYLWDDKIGRFRVSDELSGLDNLVVHPENKTLTSTEYGWAGVWGRDTYRWNGNKLELIEQVNLEDDWPDKGGSGKCVDSSCLRFACEKLINGELVTTFEKCVCSQEEIDQFEGLPWNDRFSDCKSALEVTKSNTPR